MQSDLRKKLLSNILLSTRSEPLSLKRSIRPSVSVGGIISILGMMVAAVGLIMFLVAKVKPLF